MTFNSTFKKKTPNFLRRAKLKQGAPKKREGHDKSMMLACRGKCCYIQFEGCKSYEGDETVVAAHRNEGKGMGLKNPDEQTVPACHSCHMELDQGNKYTREEKRKAWNNAYERWIKDRKI